MGMPHTNMFRDPHPPTTISIKIQRVEIRQGIKHRIDAPPCNCSVVKRLYLETGEAQNAAIQPSKSLFMAPPQASIVTITITIVMLIQEEVLLFSYIPYITPASQISLSE